MITKIIKINELNNKKYIESLENAKEIIRKGGLVAFPTETVYGLGANALNKDATKKIYEAKGRPSDNPLIVHIGKIENLDLLIKNKNNIAEKLIKSFWPGPLTLIFNKSDIIPYETSSGLDTVGIRFPNNKIAQDFINVCEVPIAAPSANSSGKPSPTKASHVIYDLDTKVDMIIDGGDCKFGLESTIVDVSNDIPYILRPGSITKEMIENVIGNIFFDNNIINLTNASPKAPGMKYTHYSPLASVIIVKGDILNITTRIINEANFLANQGKKVGILATKQTKQFYDNKIFFVQVIGDRNDEESIGSNLFKMLRNFDHKQVEFVFAEYLKETEVGLAIMNRLKKASGYNIIDADL